MENLTSYRSLQQTVTFLCQHYEMELKYCYQYEILISHDKGA